MTNDGEGYKDRTFWSNKEWAVYAPALCPGLVRLCWDCFSLQLLLLFLSTWSHGHPAGHPHSFSVSVSGKPMATGSIWQWSLQEKPANGSACRGLWWDKKIQPMESISAGPRSQRYHCLARKSCVLSHSFLDTCLWNDNYWECYLFVSVSVCTILKNLDKK